MSAIDSNEFHISQNINKLVAYASHVSGRTQPCLLPRDVRDDELMNLSGKDVPPVSI